jgi:hypothetical protein
MEILSETIERKITKTFNLSDYEILTDNGFVNVEALHETVPYEVWELKTNNYVLQCADTHIVFNNNMEEVFVKDLHVGDLIYTETGLESVEHILNLNRSETMYDFELTENSNHRYYTSGILSHNTYLAKSLAELLFGDPDKIIRVDMSEYMEKHNVAKLIGSPPGYVGHEEGGQLTEKVKNNPFSVILFDEIEKAHKDVYNILLQILDEGHLTDSFGRKVNFTNTIIIMTSNVGAKKVSEFGNGIGFSTTSSENQKYEVRKSIIEKSLKQQFNPEFLNRIDDIILFNPLNEETLKTIIDKEIEKLNNRLSEKDYNITFDKSVITRIFELNKQEEYGARPIKRIIQNICEDFISEQILMGEIKPSLEYVFKIKDETPLITKKNKRVK